MISAQEYQTRLRNGERGHLHIYAQDTGSPVLPVIISQVDTLTDTISRYQLRREDGGALPPWIAGGHIDVVVAPEYLRAYSLYAAIRPIQTNMR